MLAICFSSFSGNLNGLLHLCVECALWVGGLRLAISYDMALGMFGMNLQIDDFPL